MEDSLILGGNWTYPLATARSANAVIAFDIDYRGSKRATRPEYITVDGVEEFRATAVVEAYRLGTSGQKTYVAGGLGSTDKFILYRSSSCRSKATVPDPTLRLNQSSVLKRPRPQTPPEQISSEDEGSVERKRDSKRGRRSSDYRPSSSSENSRSEF
ncbi:uncharacterized protein N7473_011008 [Penicillium subrubescens]|uniref:uncharacterized protein n=1 Tax=Penicillium subrubescens TaxID=1316194 RepID=UPI002545A2E7|nr:uncharacterized protein N7473_011008 [Penicillium subrubescens]KAJ5884122.1 hypothetical protein N7473_011008 [Penicillium subrubescens]